MRKLRRLFSDDSVLVTWGLITLVVVVACLYLLLQIGRMVCH